MTIGIPSNDEQKLFLLPLFRTCALYDRYRQTTVYTTVDTVGQRVRSGSGVLMRNAANALYGACTDWSR